MATSSSQVPAARNTLRILSLLTSIDTPISASRIQSELDLPRSTVYHLLKVMEESGFVVHLPGQRTYGLGLAAYAMTRAYASQQPLVRVGARHSKQLAHAVGGSVHISCLATTQVLYLLEERAPQAVSLVTDVGVHLPALLTASGKCQLAYLSEKDLRATFTLASPTGSTWAQLSEELEMIRANGFAEEIGIVSPGQQTAAAPILDHLDRPAAALAVTFGIGSLNEDQIQEVRAEVIQRAGQISTALYGRHTD
ncbi:IclR family transcriptional regulator [Corynebacterium sp. H128]|uniref:IclR family transcriptional regulator n=1 Tax=unclassified Corynebacterium TaxID=2624378 RepID=UPI00309CECFA